MTEEESLELLEALGIGEGNPVDAMVFDFNEDLNVAGLHVVVVREDTIILVTHAADERGPYALIRRFVSREDPVEYAPSVERFHTTVEIR